jgi:two-component system cell cycle response regulator
MAEPPVPTAQALGITTVREIDYVCRMGGEEFAVLMPETSQAEALEAAERVREVLAQPSPGAIHFTASPGVSVDEQGESWRRLYEKTDQALVEAKRQGKNRVVAYVERERDPALPLPV